MKRPELKFRMNIVVYLNQVIDVEEGNSRERIGSRTNRSAKRKCLIRFTSRVRDFNTSTVQLLHSREKDVERLHKG